jgi:ATPase subunit of ABC transporter with duplicated ATPase domains
LENDKLSYLLSAQNLAYYLPDGTLLFKNFNFNISSGKIGIIGKNGLGKTTLLKIITGELKQTEGEIIRNGKISYFPQNIHEYFNYSISKILNVDKKLEALKRAELGLASIEDLQIISNDWNLENEIKQIISKFIKKNISLDRIGNTLSGGEMMSILFVKVLLEKPDIIIFDEPTNNLDLELKRYFYDFLNISNSIFIIVSHDINLLNKMDAIIEISNLGLKYYSGNYDFYLEQMKIEESSNLNKLTNLNERLLRQKQKELKIQENLFRNSSRSHKRAIKEGMSALEIGSKKEVSGKNQGKLSLCHFEKTNKLIEEKNFIEEKLRKNYKINIDIIPVKLPDKKMMISLSQLNHKFNNSDHYLWKNNININFFGSSRVLIKGNNGSGKTTLIKMIMNKLKPTIGEVFCATNKIAYLDQNCSLLKSEISIFDNFKNFASLDMEEHEIRIKAGRFLFYNVQVFKKVSILSGGEKLRATLACVLAMNQSPDVFILDEPTNNLDIESMEILSYHLNEYKGTLILISHDENFLKDIRLEQVLELKVFV